MRLNHFYCDFCNNQQDSDADTGYATTTGLEFPLGWWDLGDGRLACPQCVVGPAHKAVIAAREAALATVAPAAVEDEPDDV